MRSPALQPLPVVPLLALLLKRTANALCATKKISLRVPSPIHFPPNLLYRWGRMPSYRPRRTSQPIFRRAEAPWFVGLPLPTEVTLFRIPRRVNTFLWPSFAPRSPQGGVVSKDSLLAARRRTQRRRAELGALRSLLPPQNPASHCNPSKSTGKTPWAIENRSKFDIYPRVT
jgi:hypothetical protein